jgi:preprotein translocase subunit SecY
MLSWFRSPGIRRRLLVTLVIVALFRLGQYVPLPAVDVRAVGEEDLFTGPVKILTGDALPRLSVLGLGVYPVIAAESLMALLVVLVPRLDALAGEGRAGAAVLRRYTRRLAVLLALPLGAAVASVAVHGEALRRHGALVVTVLIACLAAGSAVSMLLAELLTEHGIGDGAGLLIAVQVLAVLPGEFHQVQRRSGTLALALLLLLIVLILAGKEFLEKGERRVPIQYAKRMIGRRPLGGGPTYLPLPVGGEETPIRLAAFTLLAVSLAASVWPDSGWVRTIRPHLTDETDPWHLVLLVLGICVFAFFKAAVDFDPDGVADQLKRYGAFVPGIRSGRPTAEYLRYAKLRLTPVSALSLAVLAPIVILVSSLLGDDAAFPYGGEALFLAVALTASFSTALRAAHLMETISPPSYR